MATMSMSPSSPRLPSPPPPAEDQLGPQSPMGMGAQANRQPSQLEQTLIEANAKRRIHPGSKAQDMAAGPPLVPLNELDSAFQLQEHLAALHHYHTSGGSQAITRETAVQLATPPQGIDRTLWLYELCRFLISQCNTLIIGFLFDSPPCSATTCPEMRASEWQFLCAVHEQPKSCCAIDYCCHTLDWAANVVTDPKIFPSRFVVSADVHTKGVAVKNLVNVFRRLHRIFAHAWFQHRSVFWSIEGQTGLYVFFKTVCDMYELLPAENYKLPPEAEGLEAPVPATTAEESSHDGGLKNGAVTIAKPPPRHEDPQQQQQQGPGSASDENYQSIGRTNTRRHIRASPSTGSAVTTVMETDEEDPHDVSSRMRELTIAAPDTVEEETEMADVPVIVEREVTDDVPGEGGQKEEAEKAEGEAPVVEAQGELTPAPEAPSAEEATGEQDSTSEGTQSDQVLPEQTESTVKEAEASEQADSKSESEEAPKPEEVPSGEGPTPQYNIGETDVTDPTSVGDTEAPPKPDSEDAAPDPDEKEKADDETPSAKDANA